MSAFNLLVTKSPTPVTPSLFLSLDRAGHLVNRSVTEWQTLVVCAFNTKTNHQRESIYRIGETVRNS